MSTGGEAGSVEGRRLLVATAVTRHDHHPEWDRPELVEAREQVIELFTGRFGYRHLEEVGLDPSRQQLTAGLGAVCSPLAVDPIGDLDMLAVYITCHGYVLDDTGEHVLITSDTHPEYLGGAVTTADLATHVLRGTKVRRLLLMLDTCQAGRGGNEIDRAAMARLTDTWGRHPNAGMTVIVSAQPFEEAATGAFPKLLREAVDAVPTAGHGPESLDLQALVHEMNKHVPGHQRIGIAQIGQTGHPPPFLRNPRHNPTLDGVDLDVQQAAEWRAQAEEQEVAFRDAVVRRAMGGHDAPGGGWWFTGRHTALLDLTTWLANPDPARPLQVVTGDPGSGKSAVLGLLATLADPDRRDSVPVHSLGLPPGAVPVVGVIDTRLTAQQATTEQVLHALASAARLDADSPEALLAGLEPQVRRRGAPFTVLLDGVDEASAPHDLVGRLLAPLIEKAQGRVRLLLGTRPHMLRALVPDLYRDDQDRVVDLDAARYADREAMTAYSLRTLLGAVVDSAYRDQPRHRLLPVARAVVDAAHPSFLVARITASTLASRSVVTDPTDPAWRRSLPRLPGQAIRQDLDTRLGIDAARARDLLLPLAYAQGQGLPWEDLWAPLASLVSGRSYTDDDLLWLRRNAGSYIVENTQDGRSVYRLYHQSLVEHLREDIDHRAVHDAFVTVLLDRVPLSPDGRADWVRAHPYSRTHLATHAIGAKRVDDIVTDPEYLVHATPDTLLGALHHTATDPAIRVRAIYRNTPHHDLAPRQRRHTLAVDATRFGDTTLAAELAHDLTWRPRWAGGRQTSTAHHATLIGHGGAVNAVACVRISGRPAAVSGGYDFDHAARVWDLTTGTLHTTLTGHTSLIRAVACAEVDGSPIAVTGSVDDVVRVWDLTTGTQRTTLAGHKGAVNAVACTEIDGHPVAVTCDDDCTVRVWNLTDGTPRTTIRHSDHAAWPWAMACAEVAGRPVAVTGNVDGSVHVWDLTTGTLHTSFAGHTTAVTAVACTRIDGRPVAVTSDVDRTVLVWDLATGALRTTLTGHTGAVTAAACTDIDGRPVAITGSNDNTVWVWNLTDGTPLTTLTGHTAKVNAVACSEIDGHPVAVTGDESHEVRVWDLRGVAPRTPTFTDTAITAIACTRVDGHPVGVAVTGNVDGTARVWSLTDGTPLTTLTGHTAEVRAVACSEIDGRPVAVTGSVDHTVRVWDLSTGGLRATLRGHDGPVNVVACTEVDGRPVAVTGSTEMYVWDLTTGGLRTTITDYPAVVNAVACTRVDGLPVAVTADLDSTARIWDLTTGGLHAVLVGHTTPVTAVACTQVNGRPVAVTGSSDGTVRVWDLATGSLRTTLTGHTDWVSAVACMDVEGRPVAVTGSFDHSVWLWQLDTGTGEFLFRQNAIAALAVSPHSEIINSTGWDLVTTYRVSR